MQASSLGFRAAIIFIIIGMSMGIFMGASGDHTLTPSHAHLNLVGWVSLFLISIYYRLHPETDVSRLAQIQVGIWMVGTVIMATGIALLSLGNPIGDPLAIIGSITILADMVFFAFIVFRMPFGAKTAMQPAE